VAAPARVDVVDSHTGGEPTRVVVAGGPDLGGGSVAERAARFRRDHDRFRSAVVNEPRGSDVLVGALLVPPADPACAAGVIFFNNVGVLGMCGHGTIGLAVTLAHLGRLAPGAHRVETPVGVVGVSLLPSGEVEVENVPSFRRAKNVEVVLEDGERVPGDVAWGGNWFFLVDAPSLDLSVANAGPLTARCRAIRRALERGKIAGDGGAAIDHVELFGPPRDPRNRSRNFVLCPGGAYDRSPCGTGTSAKLACLLEDGKLRENEPWRQESVTGSVFEGRVSRRGGDVIPVLRGSAHLTAEARLLLDPADPFVHGIR
jgi:4-hydroxyproline epimerase